MPRRSAAAAARTREAIIDRAVDLASAEGLEGVTIGRLADDLGMSKAGVLGHFGTKEALQLAAVERARSLFVERVAARVGALEPGLERLLALCDEWIGYVAAAPFSGGCFWAATSTEFDGRPGSVRDAVLDVQEEWEAALRREVRCALAAGELPGDTDVAQVVFELRAVGLGLNQELQLHGNPSAERRARRAVRRILGRPELPLPRARRRAAARAA